MSVSLNLVVIRAASLEASRQFYEALGLSFVVEKHGAGPDHLTASVGDAVFEIYPRGNRPASEGVRLGFRTPDVATSVAAVEQLGAVIASPLRDGPWGRRAVVIDPDGHRVEISD